MEKTLSVLTKKGERNDWQGRILKKRRKKRPQSCRKVLGGYLKIVVTWKEIAACVQQFCTHFLESEFSGFAYWEGPFIFSVQLIGVVVSEL